MSSVIKQYQSLDLVRNALLNAKINPMTSTERLALSLTADDTGYTVWDTTYNAFYVWTGTSWVTAETTTINTISPLQYNAVTGNLAITQSSASTDGYLSSADWSKFDTAYLWGNHALAGYALNSGVVHLAGTETITGAKTFTANTHFNDQVTISGAITAGSFVKIGGLSTQFLKADGSLDSNIYLTNISSIIAGGELSGTYPNPTLVNSAVTGKVLSGLNLTGGGTIAATDTILEAFGKVQNQISAMVGGVNYQDVWDASTNTPALTSGVGNKGDYYIVSVAGSTNLDGITDWKVGDWAIFNGTTWDKVDNTDAVSSVNGYTGAVSLVTSDIAEAGNLYYTDARARAAISSTAIGLNYSSITGEITLTPGYVIPTTAQEANWNTAYANRITSLTTTGTSGAATLTGNVLNIPQYQSLLTNPVTGTGVSGQVAVFNGTSSIGSYGSLNTNGIVFNINTNSNQSVGYTVRNDSTGIAAIAGLTAQNNNLAFLQIGITGHQYNNGYLGTNSAFVQAGSNAYRLILATNNTSPIFFYTNAIYRGSITTAGNYLIGIAAASDNATDKLQVGGSGSFSSSVTANSFIKSGGTSAQYLMADGSVSTNPGWLLASTASTTYVPLTRTITINGVAYDLSADRSWTVTSMVYPSAGIAVSTGTAWGASITDNSANWNTAYGWGNHALAGYELVSNKGVAGGYASLDGGGKVPAGQLPSYVDDILEYANFASLPGTGESGKIYITTDNNKTYRWGGSSYIEITASPGSTDSVAEGTTNLYFTTARARASISVSGSLSYNSTTGVISYTQPSNVSAFTNDSGYITGITSAMVTGALGYTPYNSTNPAGYITSAALSGYATQSWVTSQGYLTSLGFSYGTGVTANYVVQRDANGYMYANHINFSTSETENPSINSFFVSNGDGWSRKASVAHVKSQLGLGLNAYTSTSFLPTAGGTMSGTLTLLNISGVSQTVGNTFGAYLHLGAWGVGRTDSTVVLVNTAYRADYAESLFDMNISRFTNNAGYITSSALSSYLPLSGGTLKGNLKITPVSESWAEGLTFIMPTANTWGGLRWQRQRSGSDGNWYVGYTALDGTDDLVFGSNNGGAQKDNILRLTKAGVVTNNGHQILNAGNYSSYALPLSGGSVSGTITMSVGGVGNILYYTSSGVGAPTFSSRSNGTKIVLYPELGASNVDYALGIQDNTMWFSVPVAGAARYFRWYGGTTNVATMDSAGLFTSNYGVTILRDLGTNDYPSTGQHNLQLRIRKASSDGGCAPRTLELGVLDNGTAIIQANHCGVGYNTLSLNPMSGTVLINGAQAVTNGGTWGLNVTGYSAYSQMDYLMSDRDFADGTLVQTSINYAVWAGDPFVLEIKGNSYGGGLPFNIQIQGYIYADTIINYAGYSVGSNIDGIRAINYGGNLCFWWPRQNYWQGFTVKVYTAYGGRQSNKVTSISNSGLPTTAKQVFFSPNQCLRTDNAPYAWNMNQYVRTSDSPSFSNVYAGSDVRGNDVYTTGGWFRNHTNSNGIYWSVSGWHIYPKDGSDMYLQSGNSDASIHFLKSGGVVGNYIHNSAGNDIGFLSTARGWIFKVDNSGNATAIGDVTAYSDVRLKENITPINNALQKILQLQGVSYNRIDTEDKSLKIGFIAQEVKKVVPEVVRVAEDTLAGLKDRHSIDYGKLTALLTEAIKEQQSQIEDLKKQIDYLVENR